MGRLGAVAAAAVLLAACGTAGVDVAESEPTVTLFADDGAVAVSSEPAEAPAEPRAVEPETIDRRPVPDPRPGSLGVVFRGGVALPVTESTADGWTATQPCGDDLVAAAPAPQTFVVMVDVGGDAGADEDFVGVAETVAEALAAELDGVGVASGLTRRAPADVAVSDRLAAAQASGARVLVSVIVGDAPADGFEVVAALGDGESHRLAGLLFDNASAQLDGIELGGNGAVTTVVNQRGSDFYAALRTDDFVAAVVRVPVSSVDLDAADAVAVRFGRALAAGVYDFLTSDLAVRTGAAHEVVRTAPVATPQDECVDPTVSE